LEDISSNFHDLAHFGKQEGNSGELEANFQRRFFLMYQKLSEYLESETMTATVAPFLKNEELIVPQPNAEGSMISVAVCR
jgi:hypothetical protein